MYLVCEWFKKAEHDLIVAKHLFEDLYPKQIEIGCYHSQQANVRIIPELNIL